ncbi:CubicO group peptidase (beta-lactamase class C family) [Microbacterium resistens]|uniref:CubicO group peptidase (Beta-lactamase class C family) n=1 Tax=Microbacterium resistens TaxID=156977 RepID=A0ABU1SAA7_9MICO|nr:serine hydrolase domain-containing protein [Microbacterium resistens]MDR6866193.1 CubicO group peptidase (beta-lactamase class C family) [Microbacterium resistens]
MSAAGAVAAVLAEPSAPRGAVAGVISDAGRDIAAGGLADLVETPMTTETAFDIASVSKVAATTTAILRLAGRGELRFDDAVDRFLPGTACAQGTTVRHLLQHRAGLWEWQPLYLDPAHDAAAAADALPLRYGLDEGRHYSDLGFMLLGRIVSAVTGLTLDGAVRELVTAPLGLARTGYGPVSSPVASSGIGDAAERRMVATGEPYPLLTDAREFAWRVGEITGLVNDGNCFHAWGGVAGHAGLFSTVDDLLTLGAALAAPERHAELWRPEVVAELFRDGPDPGQALGWRSDTVTIGGRDSRMLWHPGYTGCALGLIPDTGIAAVLLSNRLFAPEPAPTETLWRAALPALLDGGVQDQAPTLRDNEGTRTS